MLSKLKTFFDKYLNENDDDETSLDHRLQLAAAALMVEMLHVDEQVTDEEALKLREILNQRFDLNDKELVSLIDLAHDEKHDATDYHQFTSLLNMHYEQKKKVQLIEDLWKLAYADDELDKYEEHLLRRLADLLHVPHKDFIRTKHKTLKENT